MGRLLDGVVDYTDSLRMNLAVFSHHPLQRRVSKQSDDISNRDAHYNTPGLAADDEALQTGSFKASQLVVEKDTNTLSD